jgi:REP element-mobilizing transposase RayT
VNFNLLLKTKSRQWVLAGDIEAAVKRALRDAGEERRINLIDWEASLDSMHLRIGPQKKHPSRTQHCVSGASARLKLRAAPGIRLAAGASAFSQKRNESQLGAPGGLSRAWRSGRDVPKGAAEQVEPLRDAETQ